MRRLLSIGVAVATALALAVPVLAAAPAHAATATTVVLSFDGTLVTAATTAAPLLDAHGMHGTFYVNSDLVGSDGGHLSWDDLTALQQDGHEVGGHALDMVDLTTLPLDQVEAQVCQDRANLVNHGLTVTDFAYPSGYGYETPAVHDVVPACGYNSARRAWGLYSPSPDCINNGFCYPAAGALPPADPYAIPTPDIVQSTTTLADLEAIVTRADAAGGGLVPIVFQEICDGCDQYSISEATLSAFLDWLQTDSSAVVETMHEAIGGPVQPLDTTAPTTTIACNAAACSSGWYNASNQVSLAATDTGGSGVDSVHYTTDGSDPTRSSPTYTAPFSLTTTTTVKYRAYDVAGNAEAVHTQLVHVDSLAPATTIGCDGVACANTWSTDSVQVSLAATDTGGSGLDSVHYTTDGTDPTTSSPTYGAPFSVAATTTVKYRAWDKAGNVEATHSQLIDIDNTAPASSIACNGAACTNDWYPGSVQVSLAATDAQSGVTGVYFTTDGTTPTQASPIYSAPLSLSATTTIEFRSYDLAGNAEAVQSQLVHVDDFAPATAIECNAVACSGGWSHSSVMISLAASDTGGAGVDVVRYTTDGTDPTKSSPTYGAPFSVAATRTVKYRAWDHAGNAEATKSQVVRVDEVAPTSAIACNSAACSAGWYRGAVKVVLGAADAGGSGISAIHYTLDGSTPTAASPVYTAPLTLSATMPVKTVAIDNAGNVSAVRSALVRIDRTRPAVVFTAPTNGASVKGRVTVRVKAADKASGIARVLFYVDGRLKATDATAAYAFVWNTAGLAKKAHTLTAKAYDRAGNFTAVTIRVRVR